MPLVELSEKIDGSGSTYRVQVDAVTITQTDLYRAQDGKLIARKQADNTWVLCWGGGRPVYRRVRIQTNGAADDV